VKVNVNKEEVMKRIIVVGVLVALASGIASAQFKSQVQQETQVSLNRLGDSQSPLTYLFGWFNPDKFTMRHSFDLSYTTFGGQGLSLGTYTNTMLYQFADNLNARADIAFSFSPYNSLATFNKSDFNKVYLKNAELNYRPWENTNVSVSFRQYPYGLGYYSPLYNPFYREAGF
jgi:hypothetical protein